MWWWRWSSVFLIVKSAIAYEKKFQVVKAGKNTYRFHNTTAPRNWTCHGPELDSILSCLADENKQVFLTVVDSSLIPDTVNFWEDSLAPNNIYNFLVVCTSNSCLQEAQLLGFSAWHLPSNSWAAEQKSKELDEPSQFGSSIHRSKTIAKLAAVLKVVENGYSALLTDVDIHYFGNPLAAFDCQKCDIQAQPSRGNFDTGLMLARPSPAVIELHSLALRDPRRKFMTQQELMNELLSESEVFEHPCPDQDLPMTNMLAASTDLADGTFFFSVIGSDDDVPPLTLHNNFAKGHRVKNARWRFAGYWKADIHREFVNAWKQKYLIVDFPEITGSMSEERRAKLTDTALNAALQLANRMGRRLILPKFVYDEVCDCMNLLLATYSTIAIHESGAAPWNLFENDKIPEEIVRSVSPTFELHPAENREECVAVSLADQSHLDLTKLDSGEADLCDLDLGRVACALNSFGKEFAVIRVAHLYHSVPDLQFAIRRRARRPPPPPPHSARKTSYHCLHA